MAKQTFKVGSQIVFSQRFTHSIGNILKNAMTNVKRHIQSKYQLSTFVYLLRKQQTVFTIFFIKNPQSIPIQRGDSVGPTTSLAAEFSHKNTNSQKSVKTILACIVSHIQLFLGNFFPRPYYFEESSNPFSKYCILSTAAVFLTQ